MSSKNRPCVVNRLNRRHTALLANAASAVVLFGNFKALHARDSEVAGKVFVPAHFGELSLDAVVNCKTVDDLTGAMSNKKIELLAAKLKAEKEVDKKGAEAAWKAKNEKVVA